MSIGTVLSMLISSSDMYCQFDEEEALYKIFKEIGTTTKKAVEFGCHADHRYSNCKALEDAGWEVWYFGIEGEPLIIERFTAENVNEIFEKYKIPDLDFLSIDVDGMDYWIWKALKSEPRVVCIEYNIRRTEGIQPYNADNVYNPSLPRDWFGASQHEMVQLGKEKGYKCVHVNEANLFFVKQ